MTTPALKERLTNLLVLNKVLTQKQLDEALKVQKEKKERISNILVRLGYISRENMLEVLSVELGIPAIHLSRYKIEAEAIAVVPKKIAQIHTLIPVSRVGNTLTIAMADPMNMNALDDVRRVTSMEVRMLVANENEIREAVDQYYGENVSRAIQDVMEDIKLSDGFDIQAVDFASAEDRKSVV